MMIAIILFDWLYFGLDMIKILRLYFIMILIVIQLIRFVLADIECLKVEELGQGFSVWQIPL